MANMVDFAADDAWIALEYQGETVSCTPPGSTARDVTLIVKPLESTFQTRNGFIVEIHRIKVSGKTDVFVPVHGYRLVHGGRTWDYAEMWQEPSGGFVSAFFHSLVKEYAGAVDSPA